MQQVLFRIPIITQWSPDGVPIYGFGVMLFFAFLICTWMGGRRAEREGIPKDTIQDLAIWLFIGGLAGARLVHLIGERHLTDPWVIARELPRIWDGGIVLYGSIIGGTLAYFLAYFLVYRHQYLETRRFMDVAAPTIVVGIALGRIGCLLNGCCYGSVACASCVVTPIGFPLPTECRELLVKTGTQTVAGFTLTDEIPKGADFRVVVVDRVEESSAAYQAGLRAGSILSAVNGKKVVFSDSVEGLINSGPRGSSALALTFTAPGEEEQTVTIYPRTIGVYPTQVYETVSMLLLLLVLLAYEPLRKNPGQVIALLMFAYGIHRYLNEKLRADTRPVEFELACSVALIGGGLVMWLWLQLKAKEPPATAYVGKAAANTAPAPSQG